MPPPAILGCGVDVDLDNQPGGDGKTGDVVGLPRETESAARKHRRPRTHTERRAEPGSDLRPRRTGERKRASDHLKASALVIPTDNQSARFSHRPDDTTHHRLDGLARPDLLPPEPTGEVGLAEPLRHHTLDTESSNTGHPPLRCSDVIDSGGQDDATGGVTDERGKSISALTVGLVPDVAAAIREHVERENERVPRILLRLGWNPSLTPPFAPVSDAVAVVAGYGASFDRHLLAEMRESATP
nr:hypothetical protein [Pseudonocardia oroxyli]